MALNKIEQHNSDEMAKSIADFLPGGQLWSAKNIADSNLRNLLVGISLEFLRAEGYLKALQDQFLPDKTDQFISEWESAVGIPDCCFTGEGTNEERRRAILTKLASFGVQTATDFENLAAVFGINVTVKSASDTTVFPLIFPILFYGGTVESRFTIIVEYSTTYPPVTFPFVFPIQLGDPVVGLLECLFNRLKPANCRVVFVEV